MHASLRKLIKEHLYTLTVLEEVTNELSKSYDIIKEHRLKSGNIVLMITERLGVLIDNEHLYTVVERGRSGGIVHHKPHRNLNRCLEDLKNAYTEHKKQK